MGKKGSWFGALKRVFGCNSEQKSDAKKSGKEKRRWGFGRFRHHEPPAPIASFPEETVGADKTLVAAEEEQNKHAFAVAVATAAAAEAAVAAAHAAAEVVRLTGSYCPPNPTEQWAAVKIQTAFRGYMARRSFRALKGLVRLQALVRGQNVRRQATATLRCMQALVKVQSQVRSRRIRLSEENQALQRHIQQRHEKELENRRSNSEAGHLEEWDDSLLSKEEIEARLQSKLEAAMKRERALAYAFSHQLWKNAPKSALTMLMEIDPDKPHWGWSWLERWMATRPWESYNTIENEQSSAKKIQVTGEVAEQASRVGWKQSNAEVPHNATPKSAPFTPHSNPSVPNKMPSMEEDVKSNRSVVSTERLRYSSRYTMRAASARGDESLASSPAIPSYMASTESAKAKVRSQSTPRQRPRTPDQDYIAYAKKRLSFPLTETNSGSIRSNKTSRYPHTSPSFRGLSGPLKSDRSTYSLRDLSIESDNSLLNGGCRRPFR